MANPRATRCGDLHAGVWSDTGGRLSELQAVLDAMEVEDADEVRELLAFREDSAGGLMTTDYFRAQTNWTVGEAEEKSVGNYTFNHSPS